MSFTNLFIVIGLLIFTYFSLQLMNVSSGLVSVFGAMLLLVGGIVAAFVLFFSNLSLAYSSKILIGLLIALTIKCTVSTSIETYLSPSLGSANAALAVLTTLAASAAIIAGMHFLFLRSQSGVYYSFVFLVAAGLVSFVSEHSPGWFYPAKEVSQNDVLNSAQSVFEALCGSPLLDSQISNPDYLAELEVLTSWLAPTKIFYCDRDRLYLVVDKNSISAFRKVYSGFPDLNPELRSRQSAFYERFKDLKGNYDILMEQIDIGRDRTKDYATNYMYCLTGRFRLPADQKSAIRYLKKMNELGVAWEKQ